MNAKTKPNYGQIRAYCLQALEDSRLAGDEMTNAFGIGQVNTTLLAEDAAEHFDIGEQLDIETSDLWDAALEAAEIYSRKYNIPE